MEYVPYEELAGRPSIVVDGTPAEGTVLTLSHWVGAGTPEALTDDLSTQIAFRYLDHPDYHVDVEAVSNNHFDEDGLCGIFAVLHPDEAQRRRAQVIEVASAGDFNVCRDPGARRVAFAIATYSDEDRSPLEIADLPYPKQSAALYRELLALLPKMLDDPDAFAGLWRDEDAWFERDAGRVSAGSILIEERPDVDLAIVTIPTDGQDAPWDVEDGWTGGVHPMAVYNATARNRVLFVRGRAYALRYRYETWVRYVSRPTMPRIDLAPLASHLSSLEPDATWGFDGVRDLTPSLRVAKGSSGLEPARVIAAVEGFLREHAVPSAE